MVGGDHRGLNEEEVGSRFRHRLAKAQGRGGGGTDGGDATAGFDRGDPLADQVFAHRLGVELLHQGHERLLSYRCDPIKDRVRSS